jgi:hypothetical protein
VALSIRGVSLLTKKVRKSENDFALKTDKRILLHYHQATNASKQQPRPLQMLKLLNNYIRVQAVLKTIAFYCLIVAIVGVMKL